MLERLTIRNYALIEKSDIDFRPGMSVITGETGAGKSIMLGALQLLLGGRADSKVLRVRDKNSKTVVEALFSSDSNDLKAVIENNNLEWLDGEIIVRREILPGGRSRAFVNDVPVTLGVLSEISAYLIEIHSQHLNIQLFDHKKQLELIDAVADDEVEIETYRRCFRQYVDARNSLETMRQEHDKNRENQEFLTFRLDQLNKLKPKRGELQDLERRYEILYNASSIKDHLVSALNSLSEGQGNALNSISEARRYIGDVNFSLLEKSNCSENDLPTRLESVYIELKDIVECLEGYSENVSDDPDALSKISDRLNRLYDAQRRFHVENADKLVDLHEDIQRQLSGTDAETESINELAKKLKRLGDELKSAAEKLSMKRREASETLARMITSVCRQLGLPNLRLSILLKKGKFSSSGADVASFICSFNKNQDLQPIEQTASGGEVSRLMLGIKTVLTRKMSIPTIIFDEIDTGVSGEIASKMGDMMQQMGMNMQVIAITHLPQVASKGKNHYKVYKEDVEDCTVSHIVLLSEKERVSELASMLSGEKVDEAAIKNARSLLGLNGK